MAEPNRRISQAARVWLLKHSRLHDLAFFTLMYFFTETNAIPAGKWEFVWRFFAGPFNFLF